MTVSPDYPILHFPDRAAWAEWLDQHHASERGVWVRIARKAAARESLSYDEAVELALCYGWIDGQARRYDEESWLQKYTPRRKRSIWSRRNRERVEKLMEDGAMKPAGLVEVEAAKSDGRWDRAYDAPASASVPEDLQAALDANPAANAFFQTLKGQNRYAILHRIQTAVKPETRARRIEKFIGMLERRETIYP